MSIPLNNNDNPDFFQDWETSISYERYLYEQWLFYVENERDELLNSNLMDEVTVPDELLAQWTIHEPDR